jgi:hypothetical protein
MMAPVSSGILERVDKKIKQTVTDNPVILEQRSVSAAWPELQSA